MRLLFAVILGMMFCAGHGVAQEDDVNAAASDLQQGLSTLKQSVEKLSVDNDQRQERNKAVKARILQLQEQLGRLQAQGDLLNKTAARLQEKTPSRTLQIARLEKENADLDGRTQKAEAGIALIQESVASEARLEKEKLQLMKMIYDSQQRQEALYRAILKRK